MVAPLDTEELLLGLVVLPDTSVGLLLLLFSVEASELELSVLEFSSVILLSPALFGTETPSASIGLTVYSPSASPTVKLIMVLSVPVSSAVPIFLPFTYISAFKAFHFVFR